jgi:hypothetical protein
MFKEALCPAQKLITLLPGVAGAVSHLTCEPIFQLPDGRSFGAEFGGDILPLNNGNQPIHCPNCPIDGCFAIVQASGIVLQIK